MTNENRKPRDPFAAFFNTDHFENFERRFTRLIKNVFQGISLSRTPFTLVATLDAPGVSKSNVKVEFTELDHGFTRLSIFTVRGEKEDLYTIEFRENVEANSATAVVKHGVVTVTVPLVPEDEKVPVAVPVS